MEDLYQRATKYALSAGRTQEAQRIAAEKTERLSKWLGRASTILSAIVATSIFTDLTKTCPIPFGVAALIAAALSALQRTAKLDEQSEAYRLAGAEYGSIRRQADMLRLRLRGGDIPTRDEALCELYSIGETLSEQAKKSRTLPESIYAPAKQSFDSSHHEAYFTIAPTHAGGVVVRTDGEINRYLLIQANSENHEWVLPKGHIKSGESSEQAAKREVREETGVKAVVLEPLDPVEFSVSGEMIKADFFLMKLSSEGQPDEVRQYEWFDLETALEKIAYNESRQLLCQAASLVSQNR